MKIANSLSDEAILSELGLRIANARLERNFTQATLAAEAGVSKRTLERLEAGQVATQLSGFVRVCRVLGLVDRLDALVPEPVASPVAQLKLQGRTRKRASRVTTTTKAAKTWTWGKSS
jgi:transcriptional regulator with XRE-family HTH domain